MMMEKNFKIFAKWQKAFTIVNAFFIIKKIHRQRFDSVFKIRP